MAGPLLSPRRSIGDEIEDYGGSERMQRSRMMAELRRLVHATRLARANRMTLSEVMEEAAERREGPQEPSRRRFVRDMGAVAGTGLLLNSLPARAFDKRGPRIAIVGGGMA